MAESDVELVEAVLTRDPDAADRLAERCRGLVIGLALGRFGLDREAAEELLQATIERLWERDHRALAAWRGEGKITTYVTVIATRLWLNRPQHVADEASERDLEEVAAPAPQLELVATRERRSAVERSIARLSARDRLVLRLRFGDEEPPSRIAGLIGLKPGAARKAVHDALVRLRREVGEVAPEFLDSQDGP